MPEILREEVARLWQDARIVLNAQLHHQEQAMLEQLELWQCAPTTNGVSQGVSVPAGLVGGVVTYGDLLPTSLAGDDSNGGGKFLNTAGLHYSTDPADARRDDASPKDDASPSKWSRQMSRDRPQSTSTVRSTERSLGQQSSDASGVRQQSSRTKRKVLRAMSDLSSLGVFSNDKSAQGQFFESMRRVSNMSFPPKERDTASVRCTRSWKFNSLLAMVIGLNAVTIGLHANEAVGEAFAVLMGRPSRALPVKVPEWTNFFFATFFTIECGFRLFVERSDFIFGPQRRWNVFDLFLVVSCIVEIVAQTASFSYARVLRLLRMVHVLQVIRMMRVFDVLRHMAYAILSSMLSVVWIVMVLFILVYVYSVYLVSIVTAHVQSLTELSQPPDPSSQKLDLLFGTISRSMLTVFEGFTGGRNYSEILDSLLVVHWIHVVTYVVFFIFVVFGVLNIITGIFVERATELSQVDKDMTIMHQLDERNGIVEELKSFFRKADGDDDGLISLDQFRTQLKDTKTKAHFQTLGIDVQSARRVFDMLDRKGTGTVDTKEFIEGCLRLRGVARSTDLCLLLQDVRQLGDAVGLFMKRTEKELGALSTTLRSGNTPSASISQRHIEPSGQNDNGKDSAMETGIHVCT